MSRRRRRRQSSSTSSSESDSDESWSGGEESDSEEELCDYEKRRLDNIRRNQQMMRSLGLPVKNPVDCDQNVKRVAVKRGGRKKPARKMKDESDSEEEWQPWMEEQKQRPRRRATARAKPTLLDRQTKDVILTDITNHVDERLNKVFQPQTKKASSKKQQPRSAKSKSRSAVATLESSEDPSSEETSFKPLPEFFDSDLSDVGEFLGFPPEAVVNDIQSKFTFDFQLNDRGKELFGEESNSDTGGEFKGFTLDDLAGTNVPIDVHRYPRRVNEQKVYHEEEISDDDDYLCWGMTNSITVLNASEYCTTVIQLMISLASWVLAGRCCFFKFPYRDGRLSIEED